MQAAFFDLDRTVMSGSSLMPFGRAALRSGFYPPKQAAKDVWRHFWFRRRSASDTQTDGVREHVLSFVDGHERARLYDLAPEVIEECLRHVFPEMIDIIRAHEADGVATYLVSASPIEIVGALAKEIGMTGTLATTAEVDATGRYTGRLAGPFCYGEGKAQAIRTEASRADIDLDGSFAYSDSMSDVPMLEAVGNPVCVNADRHLRAVAKERGWATIRVEARHGARFAIGSSATAGGVAALAALLIVRKRQIQQS